MEVNIHEAKTHLSRLLQRVAAGEEVTIARSGVPVARLVAVEPEKEKIRPLGMDRGKIWIADDFDAPLSDDLTCAILRRRDSQTRAEAPQAENEVQVVFGFGRLCREMKRGATNRAPANSQRIATHPQVVCCAPALESASRGGRSFRRARW